MDDHPSADKAAIIYLDAGKYPRVLADDHIVADITAWIHLHVVAKPDALAYIAEGPDIHILSHDNAIGNMRRLLDTAPGAAAYQFIVQLQQRCEAIVGVFNADKRRRDLTSDRQVIINYENACLRSIQVLLIFGIRYKGQLAF